MEDKDKIQNLSLYNKRQLNDNIVEAKLISSKQDAIHKQMLQGDNNIDY